MSGMHKPASGEIFRGMMQGQQREYRNVSHEKTLDVITIGRTIFGDAARAWLKGELTDAQAVARMAGKYGDLRAVRDRVRAQARDKAA